MKQLFTLLLLCVYFVSQSQNKSGLHSIGYQTIHYTDSSRIYKPDSDPAHPIHFRPIDIDMWYPAKATANKTKLQYGELLKNFKERAIFYTGNPLPGFDTTFAGYLVNAFGSKDSIGLLHYTTNSYKEADMEAGVFPVIIYLCSYNGMAHENMFLMEELARNGFVVISISSIGRFPGDMTMQLADLNEQIFDARYVISRLDNKRWADKMKLGLLSYSWGGPAVATLAADPSLDVKAVVSLDGSEMHVYGNSREDDSLWNKVRYGPGFKIDKIRSPYLYISSDRTNGKPDSVSYIPQATYLQLKKGTHGDFSAYSKLVAPAKNKASVQIYQFAIDGSVNFFRTHLKNDRHRFTNFKKELIKNSGTEGIPYVIKK